MKCPLLEIRNLSAWYQEDRKVLSELSLKLYEINLVSFSPN